MSLAASNYRVLLRHASKLPSAAHWVPHLKQQFQQGKREPDPTALLQLSSQYVLLVTSVERLKYLRALDHGEKLEPRDKIRATASRVGLAVPGFSDEDWLEIGARFKGGVEGAKAGGELVGEEGVKGASS